MSSAVFLLVPFGDDSPTDEAEIPLDFSADGDLVVYVSTNVLGELDSGHVLKFLRVKKTYILNSHDCTTTTGAGNIDKQNLTLFYAVYAIVFVLGADDTFEESRLNVDFNVDLGHEVRVTDNVADHVIGTSKLRVDFHANCDQTSRNGKHQVILIGLETANLATNFFPASLAS